MSLVLQLNGSDEHWNLKITTQLTLFYCSDIFIVVSFCLPVMIQHDVYAQHNVTEHWNQTICYCPKLESQLPNKKRCFKNKSSRTKVYFLVEYQLDTVLAVWFQSFLFFLWQSFLYSSIKLWNISRGECKRILSASLLNSI